MFKMPLQAGQNSVLALVCDGLCWDLALGYKPAGWFLAVWQRGGDLASRGQAFGCSCGAVIWLQ